MARQIQFRETGGPEVLELVDVKPRDPGSGEVAIDGATLLSAAVSYDVTPGLKITVRGENLTDEEYVSSPDDQSSAAPGRSVGVGLTWTSP